MEYVRQPEEYDPDKSNLWNRYRFRGSIRCHCGNEVDLSPAAMESSQYAAECDKCGQLFNLVGQELQPREQWEEPWDCE